MAEALRDAAIRQRLRNNDRGRDIMLASKYRIPSIIAEAPHLLTQMSSMVNKDFHIACLEYSPSTCTLEPFCTLYAKPVICDVLIADAVAKGRTLKQEESLAYKLFLMAGLPLESTVVSDDDVQESRGKIYNILRSNPPSLQVVSRAIDYIINKCRNTQQNYVVDGDRAMLVVPGWNNENRCSGQRYTFYSLMGHKFSNNFLNAGDSKDIWKTLCNAEGEWYNFDNANWSSEILADNYQAIWATLEDDDIIGIFNMIGATMKESSLNYIFAAIFAYVSCIGKNTFSEGWVTKRVNMFNPPTIQVNIRQHMSYHVLNNYALMCDKTVTNKNDFYSKIFAIMSLANRHGLPAMRWILEQASVSNVTHALVIANVAFKIKLFDVEVLIEAGVPETDVTNFLRLALEILHEPFSTILQIPYPTRMYANLAAICLSIAKDVLKENTLGAYAGDAMQSCILSNKLIKDIAKSYTEVLTQLEMPDLDILSLVARTRQAEEGEIESYGDDLYAAGAGLRSVMSVHQARIACLAAGEALLRGQPIAAGTGCGISNDALPAGTEEAVVEGEEAPVQRNNESDADFEVRQRRHRQLVARENVRRKRATWSRQAKQLPPNSVKLSARDIANRVRGGRSHRALAFNEIASQLYNMAQQREYEITPRESDNTISGVIPISDELKKYFILWGITVPDTYTRAGDPYTPNNALRTDPPTNRYVILPSAPHRDNRRVPPPIDQRQLPDPGNNPNIQGGRQGAQGEGGDDPGAGVEPRNE